MAEAGESSPHLDQKEQRQAAAGAPMGALVIHEIVRDQGEEELERSFGGLAWSGIAAGLSIGFSFLTQATLQARLPDAAWRPLVSGFGYSVGFLIVILGRQQLFTETTLTAVIPVLTRRDLRTLLLALRVWLVVLSANLAATWVFAGIAAIPDVFPPATMQAMAEISAHTMEGPFWRTVLTGGSAGWLIGLMVWLLPSAHTGRDPDHHSADLRDRDLPVSAHHRRIGGGGVPRVHWSTQRSATMFFRFLVPVFLGNAAGGTILAALLNHAPLVGELRETDQPVARSQQRHPVRSGESTHNIRG